MSDLLQGLDLPTARHSQFQDDLEPLSRDNFKLDDPARALEILQEELKYLSSTVLHRRITQHHHLEPGQKVVVNPKWRKVTLDGKFPLAAVAGGQTTEAGFRHMVRAQVLGTGLDHQHKQFKGLWFLYDFKIIKTYDGDSGVDVRDGVVVRAGERIVIGGGMPKGSALPVTVEGREIKGKQPARREGRRTIYNIEYTFIDIADGEHVEYVDGRPDDGRIAAQKSNESNMDKLVKALMANAQAGAGVAQPQRVDTAAELAASVGLSKDELVAAMRAFKAAKDSAAQEAATESAPEPAREISEPVAEPEVINFTDQPTEMPKPLVMVGEQMRWECPVCEKHLSPTPMALGAHLKVHVNAGALNTATKSRYIKELRVLLETWGK